MTDPNENCRDPKQFIAVLETLFYLFHEQKVKTHIVQNDSDLADSQQ